MVEPDRNANLINARLDAADELQIRLLMRLSPARRLQTMMEQQAFFLDGARARMRRAYPDLSDLDLVRLMFARLNQNG